MNRREFSAKAREWERNEEERFEERTRDNREPDGPEQKGPEPDSDYEGDITCL